MVVRKLMTNLEIYNHASALLESFENLAEVTMPVKVHFYFQKNMDTVVNIARELEKNRTDILSKYGTLQADGTSYTFSDDKVEAVNKDITDLFAIEQEVKINVIPLEWLEDMELTAKQVNAFTFMLQDEEEE